MVTVTKIFEFAYAHKLPSYDGLCSQLHGHTGRLEVEVSGEGVKNPNLYPTMVIDFGDLKRIVQEKVIDELDHKYLNDLWQYPTAETMTRWITETLKDVFDDHLIRVRVYETPTSYAEWKR